MAFHVCTYIIYIYIKHRTHISRHTMKRQPKNIICGHKNTFCPKNFFSHGIAATTHTLCGRACVCVCVCVYMYIYVNLKLPNAANSHQDILGSMISHWWFWVLIMYFEPGRKEKLKEKNKDCSGQISLTTKCLVRAHKAYFFSSVSSTSGTDLLSVLKNLWLLLRNFWLYQVKILF